MGAPARGRDGMQDTCTRRPHLFRGEGLSSPRSPLSSRNDVCNCASFHLLTLGALPRRLYLLYAERDAAPDAVVAGALRGPKRVSGLHSPPSSISSIR
jgi:hypothetical protein